MYCLLFKYFRQSAKPQKLNAREFVAMNNNYLRSEMNRQNFLMRTFIARNFWDGNNAPTKVNDLCVIQSDSNCATLLNGYS